MPCKSILVVEDDDDIRAHVAQALEMEGYKVLCASNGRIALELLLGLDHDDIPDCLFLDLMMPEMDGKTLMEIIDRDYRSRFSKMKILIATARGSQRDSDTFFGTFARIQKPFDLDELYQAVEKHCGKPGSAP